MAFRAIRVALLLSTLPLAGCGTVVNLARSCPDGCGVSPFGGVQQDLCCIKKAENGESGFGTHPCSESNQDPRVAQVLLFAADLPLSLVGDVVTWPYAAAYTFINSPVPTPPQILAPPAPVTPAKAETKPQKPQEETLPAPKERS
jgi:hypothetical protein